MPIANTVGNWIAAGVVLLSVLLLLLGMVPPLHAALFAALGVAVILD